MTTFPHCFGKSTYLRNALLLFMLLFTTAAARAQNAGLASPVPVLELKGKAYERGELHGRQYKTAISTLLGKWKDNLRAVLKRDPDSTLDDFLKGTDFLSVSRKQVPELVEEVRGIAAGSDQPFELIFAFQLLDELWVYLDKQFNLKNHHCSGLGVSATANHPAYIAQNMDVEGYMNGYQLLLHIPGTNAEPEQYILSCVGLVGLNGINANGIAVCVNTLLELEATGNGLPVAFMIRALLKQQRGTAALEFVQQTRHASGQNYILGIADSVYDFEASANQVQRFVPENSNSSVVYHTNHALVNHDVKAWYKNYHERVITGKTQSRNSELRYAALASYLSIDLNEISADQIKNALRSRDNAQHPVCRPYNGAAAGFTFSSVIYTLGKRPSVQLTNGSPDQSNYQEYFLKTPR